MNENLLKLRELSDKICGKYETIDYEMVVNELKSLLEVTNQELAKLSTPSQKLKYYNRMCEEFNIIINNPHYKTYM